MSGKIGESSQTPNSPLLIAHSLSSHVIAHPPLSVSWNRQTHSKYLSSVHPWIQFLPEIQLTSEVAPKLEKSGLICAHVATAVRRFQICILLNLRPSIWLLCHPCPHRCHQLQDAITFLLYLFYN